MSERIRYHTDLRVWQRAKVLAVKVYFDARRFPQIEQYALADQVRRAAVSVPANIAEGCGRGTSKELVRSLRISRGSLAELHSHLSLAVELEYMQSSRLDELQCDIADVHRMLNALIASIQTKARGKDSLL
jgi:four helix bundle protein